MELEIRTLTEIGGVNSQVYLRPIVDSDTEHIVRWRNNETVRSHFIFREPFTVDMHRNWLKINIDTKKAIQYIIEDSGNNLPIGSVYIKDIDRYNRSGEFGIFIGEELYRNKGIGTEAAKLFVRYCFQIGFHRIFLRVLSQNAAAIKSYAKAGFKQEGLFRDMELLDGTYKDVVFMSILESETG